MEPGERVGCYLPNSPSWVVASLGVWCAAAAVAAVGTLLPGAEAARLFDMADVAAVVTVADAPELPGDQPVLRLDAEGLLEGEPDPGDTDWDHRRPRPPGAGRSRDRALHLGNDRSAQGHHAHPRRPRRVVATGGGGLRARRATTAPVPRPPHLAPGVVFNPFGHMAGYSRLGFRMWIGRPSVIVPAVHGRRGARVARPLRHGHAAAHADDDPHVGHADEPLDLQGVKYVTSGTAPLSIDTRERFEARYGVPVMQAYGMSEVGAVAQERYDDVVAGRRGPGSVGRIAAGVEVKIRHLDDDRPGGEGEILVRTDEATTEFIGGERVPVDEDGWFATGDVGRIDDDILYITGRVQEKIIVGGFNVYPAEVEDVARRSALVSDAVVVGVPDERLGEVPVAGIVWAGAPDDAALLEEMRGDLAHYKVPRALFSLERVPLTPREQGRPHARRGDRPRAELGSGVVEARERSWVMTNIVIGAASGMGAAVSRQLAARGRLLVADQNPAGLEQIVSELGRRCRSRRLRRHRPGAGRRVVRQGRRPRRARPHRRDLGIDGARTSDPRGRTSWDRRESSAPPSPCSAPARSRSCVASQSGYMVPESPELFAVLEDPLSPGFFDELGQFFDVDVPSLAYQVSKRGVHRLVRRAAPSWGARGARIMSVSPGINDTPMNRLDESNHPIMQDIIKSSPLGRRGTPEEIANVISFITSDAASLLTGSDVLADGGMVSVLPPSWEGQLRAPSS